MAVSPYKTEAVAWKINKESGHSAQRKEILLLIITT